MGFLGKIKNKATTAGNLLANSAVKSVKAVTNAASSTGGVIKSVSNSVYDSICEKVAIAIKKMIRGINLQDTIDALDKHHAETGANVRALRDFVVKLKEFGDDGKE